MEEQECKWRMSNSEFALAVIIMFGGDIGSMFLLILLLFGRANVIFVLLYNIVSIIGLRWITEHYDIVKELEKRKPN